MAVHHFGLDFAVTLSSMITFAPSLKTQCLISHISNMVTIPDIFESFMAKKPCVNPHYETIRDEALTWAKKICCYSDTEENRMRRGDFAYFAAVSFPDTDPQRLRTITDWLNWVFVFDDQLDDGPLGHQIKEAHQYVDATLEVLDGGKATTAGQQVLKDIWERVQADKQCSQGTKQRWLKHMKQYLMALKTSVEFRPASSLEETVAGYIQYRFHSVGIMPLFTFTEYASGLQLPDYVFENASIIELERIGVGLQMLANDCASYHREKDLDCPHNMIHLLRYHGLSEQEAYDHVQLMLRAMYRAWYLAIADMPIWGEEIDEQVHQYIKAMQDVALANVNWSFQTERYFGKDREVVRKTRILNSGYVDWLPSIMLKEKPEEDMVSQLEKEPSVSKEKERVSIVQVM